MKHIFWVQFCWNRTPVFSHPWYEKRCVKKMPCTLWLNLYITCDVGCNRQTLYDSEASIQIQKLTCYDMKTLEFVLLWNNCFKRRKQQRKFHNQNNPSKIQYWSGSFRAIFSPSLKDDVSRLHTHFLLLDFTCQINV